MRSHARILNAIACAILLVSMVPGLASAQEGGTPTPSGSNPAQAEASPDASFSKPGSVSGEGGGVCAPWHRCLAWGGLALAALLGGALVLGYLIQSRGFESIEHKQGNPEGVKVSRE